MANLLHHLFDFLQQIAEGYMEDVIIFKTRPIFFTLAKTADDGEELLYVT